MSVIDLEAFRAAALVTDPFDYVCVPGFIRADALEAIHRDYPRLSQPGSIPLGIFPHGPVFQSLIDELRGPALAAAFEEKFFVRMYDGSTPPLYSRNSSAIVTQIAAT